VNACISAPQSTPTPTSTNPPTEIPPTPTLTPTPVPEGACANVLFPLLPGSEWIYQSSGSGGLSRMIFQVISVENELASIHVVDEKIGITTDDTVRCEDRAIVNLPLVYISLLLSDYLDGVLNTYQESGLTAPSLTTFQENNWAYSWDVEKLVEQKIEVQVPGQGSGYILQNSIIKIQSEGNDVRETISVPFGTFEQAYLVTKNLRVPVTIGSNSAIFEVKYTEWYESFLGLLKIQVNSASIDYSGFPIPLQLDKTLELVEYTEGTQ